jgi:hypothetical protein
MPWKVVGMLWPAVIAALLPRVLVLLLVPDGRAPEVLTVMPLAPPPPPYP